MVERIRLAGIHPEEDQVKVQKAIEAAYGARNSESFLEQQVGALKNIVADKSIEAEKTRTEILRYVDGG